MQNHIVASIFIGLFATYSAISQASETTSRQMEAHEHGHGELMMVHEGNDVMIELNLPGADVVGFEHSPETEEQKHAVASAIAKLRNASEIFILPEKAQCRFDEVHASSPFGGDDDEHGHDEDHEKEKHDEESHEKHEEEGHAEFVAEYHIHCGAPQHFKSLDVKLFKAFPSLEEIDYKMLVPNGQHGGELEADKTLLSF